MRTGNILAKKVNGEVTRYKYDAANQLVLAKGPDGAVTRYAYDAAGRMVREGEKRYTYGYLDKVMSLVDGENKYAYTYHVDGQIASATYTMGGSQSPATVTEDFLWDGLALVKRGKRGYINEPHVGGGNPVLASNGKAFFNDMLGTTLVASRGDKVERSSLTVFGDDAGGAASTASDASLPAPHSPFYFTGKPDIPGLGRAFLMRNYRADLGKWQTADPMGYPDGWNQLAYCRNEVIELIDVFGCFINATYSISKHEFSFSYTTSDGTVTKRTVNVFSGDGVHKNNPKSQNIPKNGPIPQRSYYIVDRESGGMLGWIRDWFSGKDEWFALLADDGKIDDETFVGTVRRGEFRMHPGSLSYGCITFSDASWYDEMRQILLKTSKMTIDGSSIKAYGKVTVVE